MASFVFNPQQTSGTATVAYINEVLEDYLKTSLITVSVNNLQSQIDANDAATVLKGTYDASTNNPDIDAIVGKNVGDFWIVSVSGSENLSGITDWKVTDWAVWDGVNWKKVDNSEAGADHGVLAGLADDDHTQYPLLAGRSSGQTLSGGADAAGNLILQSTANASKGNVQISDFTVAGVVQNDASGNLSTNVINTGFNKALGNSAGTVAEGDKPAMLAGRSGGQVLNGGSATTENLTIQSNPSKDGNITIADFGAGVVQTNVSGLLTSGVIVPNLAVNGLGDAAGRNTGVGAGNCLRNGSTLAVSSVLVTNGAGNASTEAKGTAHNKAFGNSASSVAEGDKPAMLAGRAVSQQLYGSNAANGDLLLESTSHMNKGFVNVANTLKVYETGQTSVKDGILDQSTPASVKLHANYNVNEDLNIFKTIGTPNSGTAVVDGNGFLNCSSGVSKTYFDNAWTDSFQTFTIRFGVKFSAYPPPGQTTLVDIKKQSDNSNRISIKTISTSGILQLAMWNSAATPVTLLPTPNMTIPVSISLGQVYDFELNFDLTTGATRLFVDGIVSPTVLTNTFTRSGLCDSLTLAGPTTGNYLYDYISYYDTVQHTVPFTPTQPEFTDTKLGLSFLTDVNTGLLRATADASFEDVNNVLEVHVKDPSLTKPIKIAGFTNSGLEIVAGKKLRSGIVQCDTINEKTGANGVVVDGVRNVDSYLQLATIAQPGDSGAGQGNVYHTSGNLFWKSAANPAVLLNSVPDFADGGEAGGANRTLGNTDAFDLGFKTGNDVQLNIESGGNVNVTNTLEVNTIVESSGTDGVLIEGVRAKDSYIQVSDIVTPANSGANKANIYVKSDKKLYLKYDTDAEVDLTSQGNVGDIINGGNTTGGVVVVGTNDAFDLELERGGQTELTIGSGDVTVANVLSVNTINEATAGSDILIKNTTSGADDDVILETTGAFSSVIIKPKGVVHAEFTQDIASFPATIKCTEINPRLTVDDLTLRTVGGTNTDVILDTFQAGGIVSLRNATTEKAQVNATGLQITSGNLNMNTNGIINIASINNTSDWTLQHNALTIATVKTNEIEMATGKNLDMNSNEFLNTLSGTYTSVIDAGGTDFTMSVDTIHWQKMDDFVFVQGHLVWTSKNAAVGNIRVPLPFTTSLTQSALALGGMNLGYDITTNAEQLSLRMTGGNNYADIRINDGVACTSMTAAQAGNTGNMAFSGTYKWR